MLYLTVKIIMQGFVIAARMSYTALVTMARMKSIILLVIVARVSYSALVTMARKENTWGSRYLYGAQLC